MPKKIHYLFLSFLLSIFTLPAALAATTIDAIAIYSAGVSSLYGGQAGAETRINQLIGVTNDIYRDSQLSDTTTINLVHTQEYAMNDRADSGNILDQIQADPTIQALRNSHNADIVLIYRPYANDGSCGVAYLVGDAGGEAFSYAHTSIDCGDYVTAHEVGHVLGLDHSAAQNGNSGIYRYARGHGVQNSFTTVMAYDSAYRAPDKIYKHSSPALNCNGQPCGIPIGQANEADAVAALNETTSVIANYRQGSNGGGDNGGGDNGGGDNGGGDNGGGDNGGGDNGGGDNGGGDNGGGDNGGGDNGGGDGETPLEKAKRLWDEFKIVFADIKAERDALKVQVNNDKAIVAQFKTFLADAKAEVKAANAAVKEARTVYGKNSIEFAMAKQWQLEAKAERDLMKEMLAHEQSILKASRLELKTFNNEVFKPAKQELAALRTAYLDLRRIA